MTLRQQARFWLIFVVGFFFLIWLFSGILLPFVAGMAIAYFLDPLADRLEERGASRVIATSIITFLFFLVFILVMLIVVPMIGSQLAGFLERFPGYVDTLRTNVAPYFIDGDGAENPAKLPLGGLTKISFPNNHLTYALTWFGLALLTLVAAWIVLRPRRRSDSDD